MPLSRMDTAWRHQRHHHLKEKMLAVERRGSG